VIEKRMRSKGVVATEAEEEAELPENATTNVVDFMSLLQKSLASHRRTPPKKSTAKAAGKPAKGPRAGKPATKKKSSTKKASAKKPSATRKAG
jgi:DNA end-binding protein Ku